MSTTDSWAQNFFERLNTRGFELVQELIAQQVTEELYLDYKGVATISVEKSLRDDDRKNLAKAISGFANSEGGVIIWGVDCRPDSSGKEVVREKYLADPTWFKSLIDNNIGSLTTPFHSAVKSVALSPSIDAPGVVVTFVPEGQNVPYYSNARNALGYYMRTGTNFLPVPHGLLAGLFGRKPTPILKGSFKPNE